MAVKDIISVLEQQARNIALARVFQCEFRRFERPTRNTGIQGFASFYNIYESLQGFFKRGLRVVAVAVEYIYIFKPHAFEARSSEANRYLREPQLP